jgi:hypothetical protein
MNLIPMGRRRFVRGLSFATAAAVGLPAAAIALPKPEHPNDKVRRLAREIMETLGDPGFIGFRQVTITPDMALYQDAEQDMPANERAALHFGRFARVMNELSVDTHGWVIHAGERNTGGAIKELDARWVNGWGTALERKFDPHIGHIYNERQVDFDPDLFRGFRTSTERPVPPIPTVRRRA